jgi:hypothetical protein
LGLTNFFYHKIYKKEYPKHDWFIDLLESGYEMDDSYMCIYCKKKTTPKHVRQFMSFKKSESPITNCRKIGHFWAPALIEGQLSEHYVECGMCYNQKKMKMPWKIERR